MNFENLKPYATGNTLHAIVETPKGSRNKYVYQPEYGLFLLKKVLPLGMSFPFDFGFIPGTRAEDGDPLDVLVLLEEPAAMGTLVRCEALGVLEVEQVEDGRKARNDRLIALGLPGSHRHSPRSFRELGPERLRQIEAFFSNYAALEGKTLRVLRRAGTAAAHKLVKAAEAMAAGR